MSKSKRIAIIDEHWTKGPRPSSAAFQKSNPVATIAVSQSIDDFPASMVHAIEGTPWARAFKADSPVSYPDAIRFATDPSLRVEIVHTNETGAWQWAVVAASHDPDFWMATRLTKREAVALCRQMGWRQLR